jgi:hypothetical protein
MGTLVDHQGVLELADRIGRAPTIGRPWLWRLKTPPE